MKLGLVLIAIFAAFPAEAQDELSDVWVGPVRVGSVAEARALNEQLSSIAELEPVHVRDGESWDAFVRRRCGYDDPVQAARIRDINGDAMPRRDGGTRTLAPPCVRFELHKSVRIREGDTAAALARRATGFEGPATLGAIRRLNPGIGDLKNLSIDTPLVLQYVNGEVALRVRDGADAGDVRKFQKNAGRDMGRASPWSLMSAPDMLDYPLDRAICIPRSGWPFDVRPVVDLLQRYRTEYRTSFARRPVAIAVIDTGMPRGAETFLPLLRPEDEEGLPRDRQVIDAGYFDDEFGIDLERDGGFPLAPEGYAHADHGVKVAAIASGAAFDALRDFALPLVRVKMLGAVTSVGREGSPSVLHAHRLTLTRGIDYARAGIKPPTSVVNWSWESSGKDPVLEKRLGEGQELVIAAAGNKSQDLDLQAVWPAAFAGVDGTRVIAVAALRNATELASFSNYGTKVSLAAPGCAIPTLNSDGQAGVAHGTSFAAPLVSFTAAMLQALGMTDIDDIQNRILLSADRHDALRDQIEDGRVLNIRDALAVHDDVVRLRSGMSCLARLQFDSMHVAGKDQKPLRGNYRRLDVIRTSEETVEVRIEYLGKNMNNTIKTGFMQDIPLHLAEEGCPTDVRLSDVTTIVRSQY